MCSLEWLLCQSEWCLFQKHGPAQTHWFPVLDSIWWILVWVLFKFISLFHSHSQLKLMIPSKKTDRPNGGPDPGFTFYRLDSKSDEAICSKQKKTHPPVSAKRIDFWVLVVEVFLQGFWLIQFPKGETSLWNVWSSWTGNFSYHWGVICTSFFARWGIVEVFVAERLTKKNAAFSEKMMMGIIEFFKRGYAHYRRCIYGVEKIPHDLRPLLPYFWAFCGPWPTFMGLLPRCLQRCWWHTWLSAWWS